jgi:hypothetical protein
MYYLNSQIINQIFFQLLVPSCVRLPDHRGANEPSERSGGQ